MKKSFEDSDDAYGYLAACTIDQLAAVIRARLKRALYRPALINGSSPRPDSALNPSGPPSRALAASLGSRSVVLANLGRIAEAVHDGRRALALAWELGDPASEAEALADLTITALYAGDLDGAARLARQAQQITADIAGWLARNWDQILAGVLIEAGDLAAARRVCAAGLARCRDAGDQWIQADLLVHMATVDLLADRAGDAAAHLRQALQIAARTGGQPGARSRRARRGDEPGHRHRVRPHAHHPPSAAAGRGAQPGTAHHPGTRTRHSGRPGPH